MAQCIFCGKPANSREHGWPDWVLQILKRGQRPMLKASVQDREFLSTSDLKIKCVCTSCNHGWMSNLENQVKPVLGCIIQDISVPLDELQQSQVARWAVKTTMVMELIGGRGRRREFFTRAERKELRLRSAIPSRTFVWLARYGGVHHIASFGINIWNDIPEKPETLHGYVSTVLAGRLAFQVLSIHVPSEYGDGTVRIDPAPGLWNEGLIPIWPFERTRVWPPTSTFSDAGLRSLCERWSKGIAPP